MQDLSLRIQELKTKLQAIEAVLNIDQKKQKLLELEDKMNNKDFWQDQDTAKQISQQSADLKNEIKELDDLSGEVDFLLELIGEVDVDNEDNEVSDTSDAEDKKLEKDVIEKLEKLKKEFDKFEFKTTLSGDYDQNNAIVALHAGTGGTDAQDWTSMLERMILRWCESKKYKVNMLDRQPAQEAGIKSVIFEVVGKYAYGYLKSEAGVHRLVRISPFDAEKMRHTSFALVEVLPELEELDQIELNDDDLEIDTFKASGHGGQSVNTTDSAVRIKHKPTGIVVTCQNERSQLQNKQTALKVLKSKLKKYNEVEQEEERKKLRGEFSEAAWGNQIRSYVLHPYKLVKDHRTEFETQDVEGVLGGDLDDFMVEYLKQQIKREDIRD